MSLKLNIKKWTNSENKCVKGQGSQDGRSSIIVQCMCSMNLDYNNKLK